ncbi:permease prefix domain 1-containing protein [Agromyces humi]|uniref:permease prefix domain 1-containing protein n=1 Tax=Agromyces humi TaxID=1766800 RepID=UPI00135958F1|nr:permease prefix domain 1-containing protein [Agromyces humi]
MTTLTDRYVWAAARTLPEAQRAEFERELRERIGDASDALVDTGRAPADAERMALVELGDPAALAASYVDRPLQLIGPRYYLTWWRLLKLLYSVVLPIAVAAVVLAQLLSGADVGDVIGNAIAVALSLAVHLGFWTTLAFAVLERSPGKGADLAWTPDMLPQLPELSRPGRRSELIGSLAFLGIFALVIVWQQFGLPWVDALETIPLLDPDLWSFWIPYFLVLILLEMLFAIAIYAWGWNWWLAVANLALNVAFVVPALWLFTTGQLINPEALEAMGWPWGDAGEVTATVIVVVVIGVAVWDVIDGVIKTVRGSRAGAMPTLGQL